MEEEDDELLIIKLLQLLELFYVDTIYPSNLRFNILQIFCALYSYLEKVLTDFPQI